MKIAVNHLTRMQPGYICVAGLDLETCGHVRPVLPSGRLSAALLRWNGGPFDIAAVVDLGVTRHVGRAPETEDYEFDPSNVRLLSMLGADVFWELLFRSAQTRLSAIFGDELERRGRESAAVGPGKGSRSLGCLIPVGRPMLYTRPRIGRPAQLRIRLSDGEPPLDLSVTDVRLYSDDYASPDGEAFRRVAKLLRSQTDVVLSVGLTRPFSSDPVSLPPVHWLQVNNIHVRAGPT